MAKVKMFQDNFDPIVLELIDLKGEKYTVQQLTLLTPDVMRKIEQLSLDTKKDSATKIIDQLIIIFGFNEKFWNNFSVNLLNDVLTFVAENLKKK